MMENGIEHKILERFKERLVVRKTELIQLIEDDIKGSEEPMSIVNTVTRMLIQKGWITPLYASKSVYAITQRGIKA